MLSQYPIGSNLEEVGCDTGQLAIETAKKDTKSLGTLFWRNNSNDSQ